MKSSHDRRIDEARWLRGAETWYRVLVGFAFPANFRQSHAADAVLAFRDLARQVLRQRGRAALLRLCALSAARVLAQGVAERWDGGAGATGTSGAVARPRLRSATVIRTDLLHALRALRASPHFTLAVVLTFAVGVGVNTSVFSFVRGILLRPLPMADADRIVLVGQRDPTLPTGVTSPRALQAVAGQVSALERVAAFAWAGGILTGDGEPVRVTGAQVGPGYFTTLGQPPVLGREFTEDESGRRAAAVVIISHRLWRDRFGGAPDVIGRTLDLDGQRREIIGVLASGLISPHDFAFGDPGDVFVPMTWNAGEHHLGIRVLRGVARLAPGATLERANVELAAFSEALTANNPGYGQQDIGAVTLREYYVEGSRDTLLLLQGAVFLVLVIGAVNVMNLTIARGIERRHGLAVRAALGAGRSALLRTVVLEVLLAGALGGALGVFLAVGLVPFLLGLMPGNLPQLAWVRVDALTAVGGAAATLLVALLAGLVPAVRLLDAGQIADLTRSGFRSTSAVGHRRLQQALATAQVGLAVTLLVGAALLIRSFTSLMKVDLGYDPAGVRVLQIDLPAERYATAGARLRFLSAVGERLAARSEVAAVSFGSTAPQHGLNNFSSSVGIVGWEERNRSGNPWGYVRAVSPHYLSTLGLALSEGRAFEPADYVEADSPAELHMRAAIVNAEFAQRFLSGAALGRTLVLWGDSMEIVGVAEPMRYAFPGADPEPEVYVPFDGRLTSALLVVRGRPGDVQLPAVIRDVVRALDASVPLQRIPTLDELIAHTVAVPRLLMVLMGGMAAVALGIAALGIYGVLAFLVARRRSEIGIRMALGAGAAQVSGMLLREGARLVISGVALGLALAWAAGRLLGALLYGVTPRDPVVFAAVAGVLGLVGLLASWLPALRASRVDPLQALRDG